ncbi:HAD family hydrolase [Roseivirga sp. BDSF3-8]|uniref:HAD family hydrolase n=1 Tax=Roseivirga sp. BDSF3-8 TaxID=3241598 RepID=UPI0035321D98
MSKSLALFDFDGTVTRGDSFMRMIRYVVGWPRFLAGMAVLSPVLVAYKAKLIPNWRAKEIVLAHFFKTWRQEKFNDRCEKFARNVIPHMVRPAAIEQIKQHQEQGHKVVLVSASAENWLSCWAEEMDIDLIATRVELKEGRVTGKLEGRNCYGPEKESRIREEIDLAKYDHIYAYGDSKGDREMLAMAKTAHYRPFRNKQAG